LSGALPFLLCVGVLAERGKCHAVFGGEQMRLGEPRDDTKAGKAGTLLDRGDTVVEEAWVAAKLVDDIAGEPRPLGGGEQRVGPDELGDDPAAIDVADQRDRHIGGLGETHIGDVASAQIDLGRAAGALDEDEIGIRRDSSERAEHHRHQRRRQRPVFARRGGAQHLAAQHDLRAVWPACGFSRTGFMSVLGAIPQARAWRAWARPISPPSSVTAALFDMFCGLNGRTLRPRRVNARPSPATISDLPTDPVPWIISARVISPPALDPAIHVFCPRCARAETAPGVKREREARSVEWGPALKTRSPFAL
jgi:hypothetical protein